jgi:hypothetical protein
MIEWDDRETSGAEQDDPFRSVFGSAIVPLPPRPGAYEQVARRARRRRMARSAAAVVSAAAGVAAVGLAGIEARHAVAGHPAAVARSVSPAPSMTSSAMSVESPATSATSATSAAVRLCTSSDITVTPYDQVAGPARIGFVLLATNRSASTCRIAGYPRVTIRPSTASWTALTAAQGGTTLAGDPGAHEVVLAPGSSASAEAEWSMPGSDCQSSERDGIQVDVTLPGGAALHSEWPSPKGCVPTEAAVTALKAYVATPR